MAQKRLSGWLQHTTGDPVCRDTPVCGQHTGLLGRGPFPLWEQPERAQSLTSNSCYGLHNNLSSRLSPGVFLTKKYFGKTTVV